MEEKNYNLFNQLFSNFGVEGNTKAKYQYDDINFTIPIYNIVEYKVFISLVAISEKNKFTYHLPVKNFIEIIYNKSKGREKRYSELVKTIHSLYEKPLKFNNDDYSECVEKRVINNYTHSIENGNKLDSEFIIQINEDILPYLLELKNNLSISDIGKYFMGLRRLSGQILYILLSKFRYSGELKLNFEQLQQIFNTNYGEIYHFKEAVINHAIEELLKTNITNLEVYNIKNGRKIIGLEFNFNWIEDDVEN
jgi:plasmid replication initiation protein